MSEAVPDSDLVARLRADRQDGFDALYRTYAERLYAYAVTVLRDRDAAEDAAHEALISAVANIERLRDPERLRPWLFAITRNACLTALSDRRRLVHDEAAFEAVASEEDPVAGASAEDAGEIVRTALNALSPADREVLALALRSDLDAATVAAAMGSSSATARARISRAKGALTESVLGLVLARQQQQSCAGLGEALRGFTGEWTPLLRKRVAKHVRACPQCSEDGNRRAVSYVSGFALPVVLLLPLGARARADEMLATLDLSAAAGAGSWTADGFPKPVAVAAGRFSARRLVPVAAGVAAVCVLVLVTVVATGSAEPQPPAPTPSQTPAAVPTIAPQQSADPAAGERSTGKPTKQESRDDATDPGRSTTPGERAPQDADPRQREPSDRDPGRDDGGDSGEGNGDGSGRDDDTKTDDDGGADPAPEPTRDPQPPGRDDEPSSEPPADEPPDRVDEPTRDPKPPRDEPEVLTSDRPPVIR